MGSTFRRINTNAISCSSSSGGVVVGGGTGAQQQQQQQPQQQQQQQHGRQRLPGSFFVTNHQPLVLVGLFLLAITVASNAYRYGCVVLQQVKTAESFDQKKAIENEKYSAATTTIAPPPQRRSVAFEDHVQTARNTSSPDNNNNNNSKRFCPCCGWHSHDDEVFQPYNNRLDAKCPDCSALERHRTSCAVLGTRPELLDVEQEHQLKRSFDQEPTGSLRLVYFGPHQASARVIDASTYRVDQIWADYSAERLYNHGGRTTKTVQADIMQLQFPNHFAHGAILLHVIEHIPDLRAAFGELRRVLKPYSWILLEVPVRETTTTVDCRPAASDEERIECAGQKDHVWSFSMTDFEHNVLNQTAGLVECQNVHPMLLERLGRSVYDRFQLQNTFQDQPLPQYLCRTPAPGMGVAGGKAYGRRLNNGNP
jgi:SAM-dependent methyltransferase